MKIETFFTVKLKLCMCVIVNLFYCMYIMHKIKVFGVFVSNFKDDHSLCKLSSGLRNKDEFSKNSRSYRFY